MALSFGLIGGLIIALLFWMIRGLVIGLIVGLNAGAVISGLTMGINRGILIAIFPIFWVDGVLFVDQDGRIGWAIGGLILGLFLAPVFQILADLESGTLNDITLPETKSSRKTIFGLVNRLAGSTDRIKVGKTFPNHGIKLALRNSLFVILTTCLTVGLAVWPIFGLSSGLRIGVIVGLIAGLNRSSSAVIKHYALRLILSLNRYTPFRFIKFLDHCARLILLKKVGGGYIFIHRMLLEYFAEMPLSQKLRRCDFGNYLA